MVRRTNNYNHEQEQKTGLKTCRVCAIEKPFSSYPINRDKPNGVSHDCKACQSLKTKLKYFSITEDQYNKLKEDAGNCCEICGITEKEALDKNKKAKHYGLYIDHDHSTNEIRGLLCHNCNLIMGHAKDQITTLLSAIKYLEVKKKGCR